jgi:hypothetical protein
MRRVRKTRFAACAALGLTAAVALLGCGGSSGPERSEVDGAYLKVAQLSRQITFEVEHVAKNPPSGYARIAHQLKPFLESAGYTANFLQTLHEPGPIGKEGIVLQHSLHSYEVGLASVLRRARDGRPFEAALQEVQGSGLEARKAAVAWEKAIRADLEP